MPDLRETLAKRLSEIVWTARHTPSPPGTPYCDAQFSEYWVLADECIRQMEWARFRIARKWSDTEGSGTDHDAALNTLEDQWNHPCC